MSELHTTAASIAAALRRAADDLDKLADIDLSPVAVQINLQAVSHRGTSIERQATVDRLGMVLVGHAGETDGDEDAHHRLPFSVRDRGDLDAAVYTAVDDFRSRS